MPFPAPKPAVHAQDDCAICHEPLVDSNSNNNPLEPSYVIDDVQLRCGHHFHKSCVVEHALSSPDACQRCAICRSNFLNSNGQHIVTVKTENGHVSSMDLGREINDYKFYEANPDVDRSHTFLSLMSRGGIGDAEKFLKGEDGMGQGRLSPNVTYEFGGQTAMHMAA
ncbi:MAG: hypothetical protein Q9218_004842 [Villophora microphyllina]